MINQNSWHFWNTGTISNNTYEYNNLNNFFSTLNQQLCNDSVRSQKLKVLIHAKETYNWDCLRHYHFSIVQFLVGNLIEAKNSIQNLQCINLYEPIFNYSQKKYLTQQIMKKYCCKQPFFNSFSKVYRINQTTSFLFLKVVFLLNQWFKKLSLDKQFPSKNDSMLYLLNSLHCFSMIQCQYDLKLQHQYIGDVIQLRNTIINENFLEQIFENQQVINQMFGFVLNLLQIEDLENIRHSKIQFFDFKEALKEILEILKQFCSEQKPLYELFVQDLLKKIRKINYKKHSVLKHQILVQKLVRLFKNILILDGWTPELQIFLIRHLRTVLDLLEYENSDIKQIISKVRNLKSMICQLQMI